MLNYYYFINSADVQKEHDKQDRKFKLLIHFRLETDSNKMIQLNNLTIIITKLNVRNSQQTVNTVTNMNVMQRKQYLNNPFSQ